MKKLILFLSLFMAVSSSVFAQEIRVKSYKALERDLTARTQERLDRNDNPCSVIKIVSSGKDFSFEGNVIGDPVVKNGETMIYITEGTRRLTIRHAKYGVLRYELPERVKKQTVYELTLKLIEDKNNKLRTLVMPVAGINPEQFSYGIMVGLVKRTGGYIKAKYSFKNVSMDNMECDDSGVLTGTEGSLPWYSGNTEKSRLAITGGVLQRIWKTGYVYAGAGYGFRTLGWETTDGLWVKNIDHSYKGVEAEIGLIIRFGGFAISAGAQTNQFKYAEANVGIGIMF